MKVVIVNTFDLQGGAARAAHRLHSGLLTRGIESTMIVRHKTSDDERIIPISSEMLASNEDEIVGWKMIDRYYIERNRSDVSNSLFSIPSPAYDLTLHPAVRAADVINIHWVNFFLTPATINSLLNLGKPLIWTLHDQNPFTGGCHYAAGCLGYEKDCFPCPQLVRDPCKLPAEILKEKAVYANRKNLAVVTPSAWLSSCAQKSRVLGNQRIEVIPNGLDTNIFSPHDKVRAKTNFGLKPDDFVILVGADSGREIRKGFHIIREVISRCLQDTYFCRLVKEGRIHLFSFGSHQEKIEHLGFPVRKLGYIDDDFQLSLAYAAADIFLFPSLEDNLPNTVMEAMSCGTPVLAFDTGGIKEMISNGYDGYLVSAFDVVSMTNRLLSCIHNPDDLLSLSEQARKKAERDYSLSVQADRFEMLFHDMARQCVSASINPHTEKKVVPSVSSSQLIHAVDSFVFILNKELFLDIQKMQAELSMTQKKLAESLQEISDLNNHLLYAQHRINCLSSAKGALRALVWRLAQKIAHSQELLEERKLFRSIIKLLLSRLGLLSFINWLRSGLCQLRAGKTETPSNAIRLDTQVNAPLVTALSQVRALQGKVDEESLASLFDFGQSVKKVLCIEPSVDMLQAAAMFVCVGADIYCIGENHELLFASRIGLKICYGDVLGLLGPGGTVSLREFDCVLMQTSGVSEIAWLLAESAHFLPLLVLYRSDAVPKFSLPHYSPERTIGDFYIMRSSCLTK